MFKNTILTVLITFGFAVPSFAETYLIDVRTPEEFASEHIGGALNIEYQNIITEAENKGIKSTDEIYVYCRSGKRAEIAKQSLNNSGFSNVTNLGGIENAKEKLGR
jgi:phage shock protein E